MGSGQGSGTGTLSSSPLLSSFRDSYRDLLRYLSHRTGSADEARDVAHDTWLRLADMDLRGEQPALCEGEARAYVFAMARNLVIDRQRHAGMVARHAGTLGQAGHHAPDECEALMYRQAVEVLEAALATVPERARQVFLRNRINGEEQGALAAEFGVSRNMIERDMMQAMDCVQTAMEGWHSGTIAAGARGAQQRTGRRRSLTALLGVAGLAVGGLGGWRWWRMAVPQWQQVLASGHGQGLGHVLPDGSVLTLDAQTRVEMAYYGGQRSARLLAGAVFFDVVRDAGRPFVVDVPRSPAQSQSASPAPSPGLGGSVRITVLGTRFGVDLSPAGTVQVQVESGRVQVQALDAQGRVLAQHELGAGDGLVSGDGGSATLARLAQPGQAAGWRHGAVVFDAIPLADAVERLRRYLPRAVQVDAAVAGLRLSGQVRIAQAEDLVRALPGIVPVQSRLQDGRWYIRRA